MPQLPTRIVLTGFMGSGKSTVGRMLAAELGYQFLDLDKLIEQRAGQTVPEIFSAHGEPHFRTLEHEALADTLTQEQTVTALGGGAVETPANHALLANTPDTAVIHLDAPFAVLYARCLHQAEDPTATARPNLGSEEAAHQRHARRATLYAAMSTHTIDTTMHTPAHTTAAILTALLPPS
jgi:shikimate kinase